MHGWWSHRQEKRNWGSQASPKGHLQGEQSLSLNPMAPTDANAPITSLQVDVASDLEPAESWLLL